MVFVSVFVSFVVVVVVAVVVVVVVLSQVAYPVDHLVCGEEVWYSDREDIV